MKRSIAFCDAEAEQSLQKMLRACRATHPCGLVVDECFEDLQERSGFQNRFAVLITVQGHRQIPLPPNLAFSNGQLIDNPNAPSDDETEEALDDEWLRQNIREAGLRIQTKVYEKKGGGKLLAVMEHDATDYDTWECIDSDGWGDKATFLVTCTQNKVLKKGFLCPPPLTVRYDVMGGVVTSSIVPDQLWGSLDVRLHFGD